MVQEYSKAPWKVLVSLSGGLDSCTVLSHIIEQGAEPKDIKGIGFCYGSKHNKYENEAARAITDYYGIQYDLFDISGAMNSNSSALLKTGNSIPEGHYEQETMKQTVVPGRNMIFISLLAMHAEVNECREIYLGIHAGDHFIYPDCRPKFFHAAKEAVYESTDKKVRLSAPFLHFKKVAIVKKGLTLKAPYHLARTCYKDQEVACGKCGSCQERLEAFSLSGAVDPIQYETRELLPKVKK